MTRKSDKRLSEEDRKLWAAVTKSATPLPGGATARPKLQNLPQAVQPITKTEPKRPVQAFHVGEKAQATPARPDLKPTLSKQLSGAPLRMDFSTHKKMRSGKIKPEGRIDLHGLTMDQAHGRLTDFLFRSHGAGKRLLLVITGKGKDRDDAGPIPVRRGVLKQQVPGWLSAPPLSQIVLEIREAHRTHGGTGAYYVYLRKRR